MTLLEPRYSRLGYASHALRKSAVLETTLGLASSTMSFARGFFVLRYHATWHARSYGPGGHRYAMGGTLITNTPPSGIAWSWLASATVCGPAFHAWSTRSPASRRPSICSYWNSTPGDTMSLSYWSVPSPTRTRCAAGSMAPASS